MTTAIDFTSLLFPSIYQNYFDSSSSDNSSQVDLMSQVDLVSQETNSPVLSATPPSCEDPDSSLFSECTVAAPFEKTMSFSEIFSEYVWAEHHGDFILVVDNEVLLTRNHKIKGVDGKISCDLSQPSWYGGIHNERGRLTEDRDHTKGKPFTFEIYRVISDFGEADLEYEKRLSHEDHQKLELYSSFSVSRKEIEDYIRLDTDKPLSVMNSKYGGIDLYLKRVRNSGYDFYEIKNVIFVDKFSQ